MTPEAYSLAERRIAVDLGEAARSFAHALAERQAELSARTSGFSSGMVIAAGETAKGELLSRAKQAWAVCQRILSADDAEPDQATREQVVSLITRAIYSGSEDIDERYKSVCARMKGKWPTLDDAREYAVGLITSELDIDLLSRRRKRLPLGDVLRAPRYTVALDHWSKARAAGETDEPDVQTALREGVLAVESLAKRVIPGGGATLGDCIKTLRKRQLIDAGTDKILEGLWAFANAMPGVRHGSIRQNSLADQDWYVLRPMFEAALTILLRLDVEGRDL